MLLYGQVDHVQRGQKNVHRPSWTALVLVQDPILEDIELQQKLEGIKRKLNGLGTLPRIPNRRGRSLDDESPPRHASTFRSHPVKARSLVISLVL